MIRSLSYVRHPVLFSAIACGVVGLGILVSSPASALECGDAQTSIISCEAAKSTDSDAVKNDSANNPVIAVLLFVMQVLTGAVGVAAVGALIYAGVLYASASGNSGQVEKAKTLIKDTVIGLVCYAFMIVILNFFIPGGVFGQQSTVGGGTTSIGDGGDGGDTDPANNPDSTLKLNVASWNVLLNNSTSRVTSGVQTLMKEVDILGVQEAASYTSALSSKVACASCDYGMYPTAKSAPGKVAIFWNKKKFTVLDKGYVKGSTQDGKQKWFVWIKFKEKTSGKVFYVINTHFPHSAARSSGGEEYIADNADGRSWQKHMSVLVSKVKELQKKNLPIFATGDYNFDYRRDNCSQALTPCKALSKDLSFKSGWEYTRLSDIGGKSSSTGTAGGSRVIDYVFSWSKSYITYSSMRILHGGSSKDGWSGSDHKPVGLMLTIGKQ